MATDYERDLVMLRLAYPEEVRAWLDARRDLARYLEDGARKTNVIRARVALSSATTRLLSRMDVDARFAESRVRDELTPQKKMTPPEATGGVG